MKDLYLTSTFKNAWNLEFNPKISNALSTKGFDCHFPKKVEKEEEYMPAFLADIEGIKISKCLFAIAENETPNWGAEVGYAYALGKPVIALAKNGHEIPLVCNGMVTEIVQVADLNKIEDYIDHLADVLNKYIK